MLKMFLDAPNYFLNNCNITYWVLKDIFFSSEAVLCSMNGCYTEVIQVKIEAVKLAGEKATAILVSFLDIS